MSKIVITLKPAEESYEGDVSAKENPMLPWGYSDYFLETLVVHYSNIDNMSVQY